MLTEEAASKEEIVAMQSSEYSKEKFDLNYPLLAKAGNNFDKVRYYSKPLIIYGEWYYMCSQWFETSTNNDRPYLLKWIELHNNKNIRPT